MFRMKVLPPVLVVLLLAPAVAFAQPSLYVCTPAAQVLEVVPGATPETTVTTVLFTGSGTFHGCVLGPDGRLYIANDNNILRLNPLDLGETPGYLNGSSVLDFTPKDLAFNVSTLYMTSAGTKVYRWPGVATVNGDNTNAPLTFTGSPQQVSSLTIGSPGRGVGFDVVGNMILASNSRLDSVAPGTAPAQLEYTGALSSLIGNGITPVGVAVNTCKEIVYADFATGSIRRVGSSTPIATFSGNDKPLYIKVDSSNVMYIVTAGQLDGSGAKVWRANFGFATTGCSTAVPQFLVEIKNNLPGVNANSAMGIAVAATDKALTNATNTTTNSAPYSANNCVQEFDFGYHRMTLEFTDCANTFGTHADTVLQVEALKATISQTTFDTTHPSFTNLPKPIEGMRYSPMGGFIVQYRIRVLSGFAPPETAPVRRIYHFDTQEFVVAPGVAVFDSPSGLPEDEGIDVAFNQSVGSDFWEAGKLDPPAGDRDGGCCSKHVVFNAGTATADQCSWTYDEPLKSGNPLFNGTQTINVSGTAKNGSFKCTGGFLRLSIFRPVFPTGVTPSCANWNLDLAASAVFVDVVSSGAQAENILEAAGAGKYKFNLDSSEYETGPHVITIFGPINTAANTIGSLKIPSTLKCFQFNKAQ